MLLLPQDQSWVACVLGRKHSPSIRSPQILPGSWSGRRQGASGFMSDTATPILRSELREVLRVVLGLVSQQEPTDAGPVSHIKLVCLCTRGFPPERTPATQSQLSSDQAWSLVPFAAGSNLVVASARPLRRRWPSLSSSIFHRGLAGDGSQTLAGAQILRRYVPSETRLHTGAASWLHLFPHSHLEATIVVLSARAVLSLPLLAMSVPLGRWLSGLVYG